MDYHANDPRNFRHDNQKKTPHVKRRLLKQKLLRSIVLVFTVLLLVMAVFIFSEIAGSLADLIKNNENGTKKPGNKSSEEPIVSSEDETGASSQDPGPEYITKSVSTDSYHAGELVLVNGTHKYEFPTSETNKLIEIYQYRADSGSEVNYYKLKKSDMKLNRTAMTSLDAMMKNYYEATGDTTIMIRDAYRSYEDQEAKHSSTKAGYSDHHTGYTVALSVYTENETSFDLNKDDPNHKWLYENAYKYGFVERYPAGKETKTGISNYTECFRYVGVLNAYLMKLGNYSMEEYIEYLEAHPYSGEHLTVTDENGQAFELYYVPVSGEATTSIPVPKDHSYTISGDNAGGFIVTVTLD